MYYLHITLVFLVSTRRPIFNSETGQHTLNLLSVDYGNML